ncbi:hypothetical protein CK203_042546 [Vitis vinifera]|uniref:Uncharacterized protein n=2 Tax=Vitis TaxID=3603 RepID=A0A438I7Z9_VITVI|nr:hypothetical protein CK203_042546 [Vitis vinifera]
MKEYNKKEAKFYGNMFARMNKLEALETNKATKEAEPMSIDSKA